MEKYGNINNPETYYALKTLTRVLAKQCRNSVDQPMTRLHPCQCSVDQPAVAARHDGSGGQT